MDLSEFATEFRKRVQGHLWMKAEKLTVGDLVRLIELERETKERTESRRPKELRVVWINRKNESTT